MLYVNYGWYISTMCTCLYCNLDPAQGQSKALYTSLYALRIHTFHQLVSLSLPDCFNFQCIHTFTVYLFRAYLEKVKQRLQDGHTHTHKKKRRRKSAFTLRRVRVDARCLARARYGIQQVRRVYVSMFTLGSRVPARLLYFTGAKETLVVAPCILNALVSTG